MGVEVLMAVNGRVLAVGVLAQMLIWSSSDHVCDIDGRVLGAFNLRCCFGVVLHSMICEIDCWVLEGVQLGVLVQVLFGGAAVSGAGDGVGAFCKIDP